MKPASTKPYATSKLKTPPICTKVPPFERARQDDSDSIKLISTKAKSGYKKRVKNPQNATFHHALNQ